MIQGVCPVWHPMKGWYQLEEFVARIRRRTGCDRAEAEREANAVMEVIAEAVRPEAYETLRETLPADYHVLLEHPSEVRGGWKPAFSVPHQCDERRPREGGRETTRKA